MSQATTGRVSPAALERRRAKITAEIATLGPPLAGSIVQRHTRCANPGCRCRADPPHLHGPYWTWTRKVGNKTVTRTLTPDQADTLRPLLDNARRLRHLVTELEDLTLTQIRNDPTQPDP